MKTDLNMRIDLRDPTLFGNDAGEDEKASVLVSYFVDHQEFDEFLDPRFPLQIARGRKGTGKSALLARFAHDRRSENSTPAPIVLRLVPSKLESIRPIPEDTTNSVKLENHWKQVICAAINHELAKLIGFAWKDNQIALVEGAELSGFKERNLIGSLLTRLISKINLGAVELAHSPTAPSDQVELLRRVRLEQASVRPVWILLDDIDTKYENTSEQRAFISSFFSAARYLVYELDGVGIRATVRSDVWASLRGAEDLDKCEQYVTDITWSAAQQESILTHRIHAYVARNYPGGEVATSWSAMDNAEDLMGLVFTRRMEWRGGTAPAAHVLRMLAGGRPRWIAQLCSLAGVRASRQGKDLIQFYHVRDSMHEFGKRRLADLYKEHQYQFSELQALLESFSGGLPSYSTEALLHHVIRRYVGKRKAESIPVVDGIRYETERQLARLLFKMGFVSGHHMGERITGTPEFVTFEDRPDLLQVDTNLDDGMTWEVQPAYRNALNISR